MRPRALVTRTLLSWSAWMFGRPSVQVTHTDTSLSRPTWMLGTRCALVTRNLSSWPAQMQTVALLTRASLSSTAQASKSGEAGGQRPNAVLFDRCRKLSSQAAKRNLARSFNVEDLWKPSIPRGSCRCRISKGANRCCESDPRAGRPREQNRVRLRSG